MDSNNFMGYNMQPFQDPFKNRGYHPGWFSVNMRKLKALRPNLFKLSSFLFANTLDAKPYFIQQMEQGDIQPAIVICLEPLLVSCYSDELDAVVLLHLPSELISKLGLQMYSRLLTVNKYGTRPHKDLTLGPKAMGNYASFSPIIADLYTDNFQRLSVKKAEFSEEWWNRTIQLGRQYMEDRPEMARNGIGYPGAVSKPISKIRFKTKMKLYP